MEYTDKYEAIKRDALETIKHYGSDAGERKTPGSKSLQQAERIAEFVRQWDTAEDLLAEHHLDLIRIGG